MERKTLESDLFVWKECDLSFELSQSYYEVEFITDFGVFKKGDKFPSLFIDYEDGVIEAFNSKTEYSCSNMERKQHFILMPIVKEPTNE